MKLSFASRGNFSAKDMKFGVCWPNGDESKYSSCKSAVMFSKRRISEVGEEAGCTPFERSNDTRFVKREMQSGRRLWPLDFIEKCWRVEFGALQSTKPESMFEPVSYSKSSLSRDVEARLGKDSFQAGWGEKLMMKVLSEVQLSNKPGVKLLLVGSA
jgi:hypothetical protein